MEEERKEGERDEVERESVIRARGARGTLSRDK